MNKKVFVIIVTYNGARWIDKNITALLESAYPVQIIAVDNQSTDNSVALLRQYPQVDVIETGANLGFGKANNIGMKKALGLGADYLFLLNQDAWVFEDTVGKLIGRLEGETRIGILSPMHFSGDGQTLDTSFETYYGRATSKNNQLAVVPFVNAAAWMLPRHCVEKVGYFEPLFGHYGEDRNYADRITYHELLIGIDETCKIVHDRIITRNYNKDLTQSRYRVLSELINPNYGTATSYAKALHQALGQPRYFARFYGWGKAFKMMGNLLSFYLKYTFNPSPIFRARKNAR